MDKLAEKKIIKDFLNLNINFECSSWGGTGLNEYLDTVEAFKEYVIGNFPEIKKAMQISKTISDAIKINGIISFGHTQGHREMQLDALNDFLERFRRTD